MLFCVILTFVKIIYCNFFLHFMKKLYLQCSFSLQEFQEKTSERPGEVHIMAEMEFAFGYPDAVQVLNGVSRCPHYFCGPCIIASPPTFLLGTAPAESRNAHESFPLY